MGDVTNELINFIYKECNKKKNKKKLKNIIDSIIDLIFTDLKPYLYTILSILILMFLVNCANFYYYIKMLMKNNNDLLTEF